MKKLLPVLLFLISFPIFSQARAQLTPAGFVPVEITRPNRTDEKLLEAARNWAAHYNRNNKESHDVYNVTENSLSIDAFEENAFYYRNLGEIFNHKIKYTLKIEFLKDNCRLTFIVREIYAKKTLIKMTTSDFFTPDGKVKDDFDEAKLSLEKTANNIIRSFSNYIN